MERYTHGVDDVLFSSSFLQHRHHHQSTAARRMAPVMASEVLPNSLVDEPKASAPSDTFNCVFLLLSDSCVYIVTLVIPDLGRTACLASSRCATRGHTPDPLRRNDRFSLTDDNCPTP